VPDTQRRKSDYKKILKVQTFLMLLFTLAKAASLLKELNCSASLWNLKSSITPKFLYLFQLMSQ